MADNPNIVFIMSDQQRQDTLACYGADWMQVPHLNALARESFVFENAYVAQPVCTPARATIMTGLYPHTAGPIVNQIHLPSDTPVIAEMISENYYKGYMGKWHLGGDLVAQHGFDAWKSAEDSHRTNKSEQRYLVSDYNHYLVEQGYKPDRQREGVGIFSSDSHYDMPEEHQMASYLGDRAADFISENKDRPFILYVSTFEPHSPYHGPFMDMYDPAGLQVGPAFLQNPESASLVNRVRANYFLQFMMDGVDQSSNIMILISWYLTRPSYFCPTSLQ